MNREVMSIKAYDNENRARSYHKKKGFSPERKEAMLNVTAEALIWLSEKSGTCLELGAGTGHLTRKILDQNHFSSLIVTEGAMEMLDVAKQELTARDNSSNIVYEMLDFSASDWTVTYKDRRIDAVTSSMALHHVDAKGQLFKEIQSILKPGGTIIWPAERKRSMSLSI